MDPPRERSTGAVLAPGRTTGAVAAPPQEPPRPAIDANLLAEDSYAELLDGRLVLTAPAEEPHAHRHFELPRVLGTCLVHGYLGAADMLTRPDAASNFAPDVSIDPAARDPATGGVMARRAILTSDVATPPRRPLKQGTPATCVPNAAVPGGPGAEPQGHRDPPHDPTTPATRTWDDSMRRDRGEARVLWLLPPDGNYDARPGTEVPEPSRSTWAGTQWECCRSEFERDEDLDARQASAPADGSWVGVVRARAGGG